MFDLALINNNWNYLGIEIREKLVKNAKLKLKDQKINNLFFVFGNANNIFRNIYYRFILEHVKSISFNFPDPWFKKKHFKRRVIQPELINLLSIFLQTGSLIFIKTDVKELYDYMDHTILRNSSFHKITTKDYECSKSFNPNRIQTNREKYVVTNKLNIFESIYIKI